MAGAMASDLWAGEKRLPEGNLANGGVSVSVSVLDSETLKNIFGSDFGGMFTVVEATLMPRGGKPVDLHMDDFLLRSEQSGAHSGPLLPGQIAGQGSLVVKRTEAKPKGGFGGGLGGIMMGGGGMGGPTAVDKVKVDSQDNDSKDPLLDVLKRKILAEKSYSEPATGLLFFPLDKEKPKNLVLIYTTPEGKLRTKFK